MTSSTIRRICFQSPFSLSPEVIQTFFTTALMEVLNRWEKM